MIFIPKRNECDTWNEKPKEYIYINWKQSENVHILFQWYKQKIDGKYNPFYLSISHITIYKDEYGIHSMNVLSCPEPACECHPQLRYNKIINKWFCMCSSSMICTKNNDKDELEHPDIGKHFKENTLNEENGYFDNPADAILNWNKSIAEFYVDECKELMKK